MQVTFNGLERTLTEMIALTASAGWKIVRVGRAEGSLFGHIVAAPAPIPVSTLDLDADTLTPVTGTVDGTSTATTHPLTVPEDINPSLSVVPPHDTEPNEGMIIRSEAGIDIAFSPSISQPQLALSEAASVPLVEAFTSPSSVSLVPNDETGMQSSMSGSGTQMQSFASSSTIKRSAWSSYTTDEALDCLASGTASPSASGGGHRTASSGRAGKAVRVRPGGLARGGPERPGSSSGRSMFGFGTLPAPSNGTVVTYGRSLSAGEEGRRVKGKGTGAGTGSGWMRWVKGKKGKSASALEGEVTSGLGIAERSAAAEDDGRDNVRSREEDMNPLQSPGGAESGEGKTITPRGSRGIMKKVSQMFGEGTGGGGGG